MKRFINLLIIVGACSGVFYLIGLITPRMDTTRVRAKVDKYPYEVAALVKDVPSWPTWHPTVQSVRERDSRSGKAMWSITDRDLGTYELEVETQKDVEGWAGTWHIEGKRYVLRFGFIGFGSEGALVTVQLLQDVVDPWARAKRLFFGTPIDLEELVTSMGARLGTKVVLQD